MNIVLARRISQVFFFGLFLWFCIVLTPGEEIWRLRGWPVNWLMQLDPLVGLATLLATGTLYAGLAWGLATLVSALLFGRVFCGWICPFGAWHQFIGWLGRRHLPLAAQRRMNRPHAAQSAKYYLLLALLGMAAGSAFSQLARATGTRAPFLWPAIGAMTALALLLAWRARGKKRRTAAGAWLAGAGWLLLGALVPSAGEALAGSLQTGLLDPLPLFHRSVHVAVLPLADRPVGALSALPRFYVGAGLILGLFILVSALNLWIPRFYCRFLCPTGALLGLLSSRSPWRIGKRRDDCSHCKACEAHCEGGCDTDGVLRWPECVLCMNCTRACPDGVLRYRTARSASGEEAAPDLRRRGILAALGSGLALIPAARLGGWLAANLRPRVIRPPGALAEAEFLTRCLKCGQCMRVCPSNIIQPAGLEAGWEGVWSPVLNFRIGTSGCQPGCVACGHVCPTAAIRPLTPEEKAGTGPWKDRGPIRLGCAFVDRGRCLPWAMDIPCIVCQENCPVSPKAIHIRTEFRPVREGPFRVAKRDGARWTFAGVAWSSGQWSGGDYFVRAAPDAPPQAILANTAETVELAAPGADAEAQAAPAGANVAARGGADTADILVRLQLPFVDPRACIGCGICEHECPVAGLRAIRVSPENETRDRRHALLPG